MSVSKFAKLTTILNLLFLGTVLLAQETQAITYTSLDALGQRTKIEVEENFAQIQFFDIKGQLIWNRELSSPTLLIRDVRQTSGKLTITGQFEDQLQIDSHLETGYGQINAFSIAFDIANGNLLWMSQFSAVNSTPDTNGFMFYDGIYHLRLPRSNQPLAGKVIHHITENNGSTADPGGPSGGSGGTTGTGTGTGSGSGSGSGSGN